MKVKMGEKTLNDFDIIGKTSRSFGEIIRAVEKVSSKQVALKQVNVESQNIGIPSTTLRQIALLRELEDIPYIVKLKDVLIEDRNIFLVFDFFEKDLRDYIQTYRQNNTQVPSNRVKIIMRQILLGIQACHSKRIIHRDMKPANILVDQNENIKIADFGLARIFMIPIRPYSEQVVTLWYRAPQILLGSREYTTMIDMWSVGCIFAEVVTGRPLFAGENQIDQLHRIFRILGTPTEQNWKGVTELPRYKQSFPNWGGDAIRNVVNNLNLDNDGIDLLMSFLVYNPINRITAKDALNHPYFNDIKYI